MSFSMNQNGLNFSYLARCKTDIFIEFWCCYSLWATPSNSDFLQATVSSFRSFLCFPKFFTFCFDYFFLFTPLPSVVMPPPPDNLHVIAQDQVVARNNVMDISDDEVVSLIETGEHYIAVHCLDQYQYLYQEMYITLDLMVDPDYHLSDIRDKYHKNLADSMRAERSHYQQSMMSILFTEEINFGAS